MVSKALDICTEGLYSSYAYDYPMESQETLFRYSLDLDLTSIVGTPLSLGAKKQKFREYYHNNKERILRKRNLRFKILNDNLVNRHNIQKYCGCGCNQQIRIRYWHKWKIPKYIQGHNPKVAWNKGKGELYIGKNNPMYGHKHSKETIKKIYKTKLKNGNLKLKFESLKKMSATKQGIPISQWEGFKSDVYRMVRNSNKFKQWRKKIFERDNYTCQECNQYGGILHPHHIYPFSKYAELKFSINNGITLCKKCHQKTVKKEIQFIEYFKNKLNIANSVDYRKFNKLPSN